MNSYFKIISLSLILFLSACSERNAVHLKNKNFDSEIELKQNLVFTFDKNLVPDSMLNRWDSISYITITPKVDGVFKWNTPGELMFSPEIAFKPATEYKAAINPVVLKYATKGIKLGKDLQFSFHTPYLSLQESFGHWAKSNITADAVQLLVYLNFNYRIQPAALNSLLHLTMDGKQVPFKMVSVEATDQPAIAIEGFTKDKLKDIKLDVKVDKGLGCIGSTSATKQELKQSIEVPLPDKLSIMQALGEFEGTQAFIHLYTNQAIDELNISKQIAINPKINFSVESRFDGIALKGAFDPGITYELTVSKDAKGILGGSLGEDYHAFIPFGQLEPSLSFTSNKGVYLSSKGTNNVGINIVNIPGVYVRIVRIYENNILSFFANNRYEYYDYYDDEEGSYNSQVRFRDYGWENYGDIVMEREYETKSLAKNKGIHLLNIDVEKENGFKGVYLVSVASKDKRWISATKMIAISDVGLIAKQTDDEVYVFANSIKTAEPVAGASISFVSHNNQVLYTGTTGKDGLAVFSNIKQKFPGFKIGLITAKSEGDFNFLMFSDSRIETSRYEIGGRYDNPGGYMAFIYGDRDLYRPGEVIHINTIVRNNKWQPAGNLPVKIKLLLPNGREMKTLRQTLNNEGAFTTDFPLPAAAITGNYIVEVFNANDVLLNSKNISVEEFMPDRIDVKLTMDKPEYKNGDKINATAAALNLFGPPAANRNYEMEFSLQQKYFYAKNFEGYNFAIAMKNNINFEKKLESGKTDEKGIAAATFEIDGSYDGIGLLQGKVFATVFDETGRPVNRVKQFNVFTQDIFYGIKITDDYANRGERMLIPLIATDKKGNAIATSAKVQIINKDWYSVIEKTDNGGYHYVSHQKEIVVFDQLINISSNGYSLQFVPQLSGEYEVRVSAPDAEHYVMSGFWAYGYGYTSANSFEVNTEGQVTIETDKEKYNAGDKANILFKTPFAGKLLVTIESNKLHEHFYITTDKRSAMLSIDMKDEYLPNVYVSATLFKPLDDGSMPLTVAHGFHPLIVEKATTHLPVTITAPEKSRSKTKQTIKIKTLAKQNIEVTIAVVDEGILQIKNYETPDPHKFFYQKRALQVTSYDLYAKLFPDLKFKRSSPGGDGYDLEKRVNPLTNKRVQLVSLWSGILKTNSSGEISYTIDVPQFSGDLRIMACVYSGNSFGSGDKHMKVADPIVISPAIPRFLSPGDTLIMPVTVTNTTAGNTSATATVSVSGPLKVIGNASQTTTVNANNEGRVSFKLLAEKAVGNATINVNVGALNETFVEKTEITVRPITSLLKETNADVIKPNESKVLDFSNDFIESSVSGKILFSQSPVVQFTDQLSELLDYPHGCAEQTISIAFPQLYYTELAKQIKNTPRHRFDPHFNVQAAINKLATMQLYNGSLSLWPGNVYENWWLSAYALHFLIEAEKAGYETDENYTNRIFEYLQEKVKQRETETYYYWNAANNLESKTYAKRENFYSLYLMALNNKQDMASMNYYKSNPQLLTMDSKYLLATAYRAAGDIKSYEVLLPKAFEGNRSYRASGGSFYSYIRDEAISLNALLETDPDNPQIGIMAKHLSQQIKNESWMSTQERAFSFLALGKLMKRAQQNPVTATILSDGKEIAKFDGTDLALDGKAIIGKKITIKTSGKGNLYYFSELSGIKFNANFKEEDNYLQVRKTFYDRYGRRMDTNFKQGDLIIVRLGLINKEGSNIENIVITDMLPAGFEIENPRLNEDRELSWIKDQDAPDYIDVRDDRINIYTAANRNEKAFYYMVRCVNTGKFIMGPVSADAMYNGEYHSYNGAGVISITE